MNCEITYEDFCAEIKDICKFDDKQLFTVKWVDEDGMYVFHILYKIMQKINNK